MSWYHTTATGGNTSRRADEKVELQQVGSLLQKYFERVRQMKDDRNAMVDPQAFLKNIQILEDQVKTLKNMYEKELDNYRNREDALTKQNNSLQMQAEKSYQLCKDLEAKLAAERARYSQADEEIRRLREQISTLERRCREAQENAQKPNAELDRLRGDLKKCLRELEELNSRYERECAARQEAENKAKAADDKMRMAEKVHAKENNDLKARLDAANNALLEMERKMKAKQSGVNVDAMIRQVREACDQELQKFKDDTLRQNAKNMEAAKEQAEKDARTIEKLMRANQAVTAEAEDAKTRNAKLEAQLDALRSEIMALQNQMEKERGASAQQLQSMYQKMQELQAEMHRQNENNGVSSDNIILRGEIETLKAMLQEEENRLRSRTPSRTGSSLPEISKFQTGRSNSRMSSGRLGTSASRAGSSKSEKRINFPLGFGLSNAKTEYTDKYRKPKTNRNW